jgi:very-short-patch-repair endonuclease
MLHLRAGGGLGWGSVLLKPQWKPLLNEWRARGQKPKSVSAFEAIAGLAELTVFRRDLVSRWRQQAGPGGPELDPATPEGQLAQMAPFLENDLTWGTRRWVPFQARVKAAGLVWERFALAASTQVAVAGELAKVRRALDELPALLHARAAAVRFEQANSTLLGMEAQVQAAAAEKRAPRLIKDILDALLAKDPAAYRQTYDLLMAQHALGQIFAKVGAVAPEWASAVRNRVQGHQGPVAPGDAAAAWRWRQFSDELDRRGAVDVAKLQQHIIKLETRVADVTGEIVADRTWAAQIKRTTPLQRKALVDWLQTIRKIGKGTGKKVPRLRAEARKLLKESAGAVPVWVMPLFRAVESLDAGIERFDVVIIDESSQAGVLGLLAWYMGKEVIIVGDDQQVSPVLIGMEVDVLQALQDQYLDTIPGAHLFDLQWSVYDGAMSCFESVIRLVEHFRCVPEIIAFSNHLAYQGAIRPLRDPATAKVKPAVIPYFLAGATSDDKVNEKEVETVSGLVQAMVEQPEYKGATIGVISLVGEEQAVAIERRLREQLPPLAFEERRILCGNPPHFQGDERDIMVLSMVDAPKDGPLALREIDLFKKRFNVAASRARDQMWLVYSLNPATDLKPGDLRKRLIEHALDPTAIARALARGESAVESPFELAVLQRLVSAGFKVTPQHGVGHYFIDLVVEGNRKRLAVECDGDKFHTEDKLREDADRQAVLERIGWQFVRLRGTQFYRDPDGTMRRLFDDLKRLGIPPEGHLDAQSAENEASGLVERVKRRAAELQRAPPPPSSGGPAAHSSPGAIATQGVLPSTPPPARADTNASSASSGGGRAQSQGGDLVTKLQALDLEIFDRRRLGGALWVVGGPELKSVLQQFEGPGVLFSFVPRGGRATGFRSGWYTNWDG